MEEDQVKKQLLSYKKYLVISLARFHPVLINKTRIQDTAIQIAK